ncbi:MAG: thioredoxin family protein [Sedimentisphaerales bacterium]|nr:thioredoxin family protein [Sedimentisphaerales bacterium]
MKEGTKNFLILFVILCAVIGIVAMRQFRQASDMAELGMDVQIGAGMPVLLQLGAYYCGPCRQMAPHLEEISIEYKDQLGVKFMDIERDRQSARTYGIELIPTQIFLDAQGNEVFRHVGYYSKEQIVSKLRELGLLPGI